MVAGMIAALLGWFTVRLSGVYLAMITLAFAQIVWAVALQWTEVTGGDNGILGVWPAGWVEFATRVLLGGDGGVHWRGAAAASDALRAVRLCAAGGAGFTAARRGDGLHVLPVRVAAFGIAGAAAGLAGECSPSPRAACSRAMRVFLDRSMRC